MIGEFLKILGLIKYMNKYWYKYYITQYAELLKVSDPMAKEWLKEELQEIIELFKNGSTYCHGVLITYNFADKSYLEGKVNAINHLLGYNSWIYPPTQ